MILTATVISVFLAAVALFLVEVESGGILELKLDRYQNSTRCAEGSTGLITGDCDYRFTLQAKAQLTASNGSLVENVVTIVSKSFDDDQDITFTIGADALGLGVGNPIDVPFGMRPVWVGIHVEDADMWDTFSEISNLETSIDLSKMLNLGIGYRNITEQLAQPTGQLDLSYKVICDSDYYGMGCNVPCVPTSNYTCNTTTGDKLCVANKQGSDCTECVADHYGPACSILCQAVPGQYSCSSNGSKLCITPWMGSDCSTCPLYYYGANCTDYCLPVVGQYGCDVNGSRVCEGEFSGGQCSVCKVGYYGPGCDVACSPVPLHYTCNEQGSKVCVGNHTGALCKSCVSGYYGTNCDRMCSAQPNYNCSSDGRKVCRGQWTGTECQQCKQDYYGANCTVSCVPVEDKFSCDASGARLCLGSFRGSHCSQCEQGRFGAACDIECTPLRQRYTCSVAGARVCEGRLSGALCDTCEQHYYGEACSRSCFPGPEHTCDKDGKAMYNAQVNKATTGIERALTIIATVGGVVVVLCIAAACFGLVSVKHYNKKWTTPVLTEILDNAKSELHNEKEVEFHMCKDVEAGVPKLIYEQVTLPDIYFRNPTFVEDM